MNERSTTAPTIGLPTGRLEAFSDGVIAIIITIMVLELKVPHEPTLAGLRPLVPVFLGYVLSFIYVGIYWNNHHHTMHATRGVTGAVLWANLHLLFGLSLIPLVTDWMGENHFATVPVALYGGVLLMCAVAYAILIAAIVRGDGTDSVMARAVGHDGKGMLSIVVYFVAMVISLQRVLRRVGRGGVVRGRRGDVAGARPPHRKIAVDGRFDREAVRTTVLLSAPCPC